MDISHLLDCAAQDFGEFGACRVSKYGGTGRIAELNRLDIFESALTEREPFGGVPVRKLRLTRLLTIDTVRPNC